MSPTAVAAGPSDFAAAAGAAGDPWDELLGFLIGGWIGLVIGLVLLAVLTGGRARVAADLLADAMPRLQPYLEPGLALIEGQCMLVIPPHALPYARSIAAAFDPYRQHSPRRFSSAI